MSLHRLITLYGSAHTCSLAKGLLENHPDIKRIDTVEAENTLRLILLKPIEDIDLISLLLPSGLYAAKIEKNE